MRGPLELDLVGAGEFDAFSPPVVGEHDLEYGPADRASWQTLAEIVLFQRLHHILGANDEGWAVRLLDVEMKLSEEGRMIFVDRHVKVIFRYPREIDAVRRSRRVEKVFVLEAALGKRFAESGLLLFKTGFYFHLPGFIVIADEVLLRGTEDGRCNFRPRAGSLENQFRFDPFLVVDDEIRVCTLLIVADENPVTVFVILEDFGEFCLEGAGSRIRVNDARCRLPAKNGEAFGAPEVIPIIRKGESILVLASDLQTHTFDW